jgi:hypothetical protein
MAHTCRFTLSEHGDEEPTRVVVGVPQAAAMNELIADTRLDFFFSMT